MDRYETGPGINQYGFTPEVGDPVIQILWTVLMLLIGGLLGVSLGGRFKSNPPIEATPAVIGRITELAELVVLRVPVSKVHVTKLGGYVGSVSCVVLVNGELELGTDLTRAQWDDVNSEARIATLVLAEPKVRRARLDHDQTSVYRIDRGGLWKGLPSGELARKIVNLAMVEGQTCVESAGNDPLLLERSREQTEQILTQYMGAIGWEISVVWSVEKQGG